MEKLTLKEFKDKRLAKKISTIKLKYDEKFCEGKCSNIF